MADRKISQLSSATTPLAGTEVLPIVQGGSTVKTAVSTLLDGFSNTGTGNNVRATNPTFSDNVGMGGVAPFAWGSAFKAIDFLAGSVHSLTGGIGFGLLSNAYYNGSNFVYRYGGNGSGRYAINSSGEHDFYSAPIGTAGNAVSYSQTFKIGVADVTVTAGNLVIGTSGKGIDFSATPGTGTSELLADYEEGTWTPTQGAGLTVVGTFSSSGTYTKVGRIVNFSGSLSGSTSIALATGGLMTAGLPFSTGSLPKIGAATNANATSGSLFQISVVTIYAVTAIGATASIYFSGTYST